MTNESIALAYLDAVGKKDMKRVEELLSPDIQFTGPVMKLSGVREVLASFQRIGAIHVRNDIVRVFSDKEEVCVIYDFVTDTIGSVPTIEWLRFANGTIMGVNLFYDQVPWMALREELARRAKATA